MSAGVEKVAGHEVCHELQHVRPGWWWFMLLGALLVVCGLAAIIFPAITVRTSLLAVMILGIVMMIAGIATIVGAFWAGKWSGFLLHLLCGILYLVAGFLINDAPAASLLAMTTFLAALFIVLGIFRIVAAFMIRIPQWGWSVLNGVITLLAGIVIYRHLPYSALWVIGLLVGLELLFNGWNWIMLALAIRSLPKAVA
jgi:uncharacterized membrane protein HdeD (DUF308 family)